MVQVYIGKHLPPFLSEDVHHLTNFDFTYHRRFAVFFEHDGIMESTDPLER